MRSYLSGNTLTEGAPLAYLLTFTCYGIRLHGSPGGSVDRRHNVYGTPLLPESSWLEQVNRLRLAQPPFRLDRSQRKLVLTAVRLVCREKQWDLIALHVRSTHVHSVVAGDTTPQRIRAAMKYRSSRLLNAVESEPRRRWTDGGSGKYLWTPEAVAGAVDYVLLRQGQPMETYEKEGWALQFS